MLWFMIAPSAWPAMHLALVGEDPERVLACLPVKAGEALHLEFINSIYLAIVRESFTCNSEGVISLTRVESPSYGVFEYYGLTPDKPGSANLSRSVGEIRLMSHNYENHLLIMRDKQIHLREFAGNGKPLILRIVTGERCIPQ
jgi:hypothetical protein